MKKASLLLATLFASSAFASSLLPTPNVNAQDQNQGQAQGQLQGQAQGQLQGQAQGLINAPNTRISNDSRAATRSVASNLTTTDVRSATGGNTLVVNEAPIPAVTLQEIRQNDYTVKNVPSIALGNTYPTSPCMGSSQVGGSGVGFSIGVGTSWTDDECGIRETSRSFNGLGLKDDALAILCTSKYAVAAPSCNKGQ